MVQEPHTAAPTPQMITAAVSPLVAQRGLTQDRLADAVAEAVVEKIKDYLQSPDAATARQVVGDILAADAPALYAYFIGLQLVVQALHDGAGDPLLPPTAAVEAQLRQLEASPTLQSYLLTAPGAVPSEEPQA